MKRTFIPFNKPYVSGREALYVQQVLASGTLSGDGVFTQKCHGFFEQKYGFNKVLLTSSCSDALEMSAILIDTKAGDEIIIPSYTFVSTANAFLLRGAKIIFADSEVDTPNLDVSKIEGLITSKTKAIVCVHYAGIACDLDQLLYLCEKYHLYLIEDAALSIDSYFRGKPLGSFGHLAAFSFHETKNITSGEGGMLVVNEKKFIERAEIIRDKGTNRSKYTRGEIAKYGWVDIGSSFLPSHLTAAVLFAQIEQLETIQQQRKKLWQRYYSGLKSLHDQGFIRLPQLPEYSYNNAHIFYLVCKNETIRTELIATLSKNNIGASFHYSSLHTSVYFAARHDGRALPNSDLYTNCLVRLPMFFELNLEDIDAICQVITNYFIDTSKN